MYHLLIGRGKEPSRLCQARLLDLRLEADLAVCSYGIPKINQYCIVGDCEFSFIFPCSVMLFCFCVFWCGHVWPTLAHFFSSHSQCRNIIAFCCSIWCFLLLVICLLLAVV